MDTLEVIRNRRSIRKYKPDPVPSELITQVLEAARRAPSGTNAQPWKFIVVRSSERREALCQAAYGQPMIREAPVVVAALGDRQVFKHWPRRAKELVDVGAVDAALLEKVGKRYRSRVRQPEDVDRTILGSCMIAIDHLTLAAASLGLGTCWAMAMDPDEVARALELPAHLFPIALVPLGYAAESPPPRPRYALGEIAFDETLDHPWSEPPGG